jgi:hypothetical protein
MTGKGYACKWPTYQISHVQLQWFIIVILIKKKVNIDLMQPPFGSYISHRCGRARAHTHAHTHNRPFGDHCTYTQANIKLRHVFNWDSSGVFPFGPVSPPPSHLCPDLFNVPSIHVPRDFPFLPCLERKISIHVGWDKRAVFAFQWSDKAGR